ncbi:MAG: bifunctional isocitrate dehydrogenase kinase/phosphatase [Gammaproteobacteria bacterium]|nr:bifunctional isocitrate dehydrogenase kinase/phosphatase [Gammaproteobacteria bacterium]
MSLAVEEAFGRAFRAGQIAQLVVGAFLRYNARFREITRRARVHFVARDWAAAQADALERLGLYDRHVMLAVEELRALHGGATHDLELWRNARRHFAHLIDGLPDNEFCKTYFSSVTRKLFDTVGVAPDIEFIATDLDPLANAQEIAVTRRFAAGDAGAPSLRAALAEDWVGTAWAAGGGNVAGGEAMLQAWLGARARLHGALQFECVDTPFFQGTRAYLVGRISGPDWSEPAALAIRHDEAGLALDAVLLGEEGIAALFSYTRTYFQVDLERVAETVAFLKMLLPRKPVGELFTSLGRAKQGKTERYRNIMQRMAAPGELFDHAPGERGLVMVCFVMKTLDVVFKVIRDHIPEPKTVTPQEVARQYDYVYRHDRAGRLVDAQEFRRMRFPAACFSAALLAELLEECASSVRHDGDDLVFERIYVERRLVPLNLYLQKASPEAAERVLLDYGQALKDLARTNLFAGDLLFKNFGVTRHGRVIFYDYDEVCPLTTCEFRELPVASDPDDEMRAEPWFYVGEHDVFPETFRNFMPMGAAAAAVLRRHDDLFGPGFWRATQESIRAGERLEVLPYEPLSLQVSQPRAIEAVPAVPA